LACVLKHGLTWSRLPDLSRDTAVLPRYHSRSATQEALYTGPHHGDADILGKCGEERPRSVADPLPRRPAPVTVPLHRHADYLAALARPGEDAAPYASYLDVFAHGMPPQGGFAIGLERWTARLTGAANIRQTALFPRDLHRLSP
jgi:tRNA synthetases class II (D, K and N)